MPKTVERSMQELYADDPERADAKIFGRKTNVDRRGFLGGAGLAAMGAAVGGAIPFAANMPGGLIPAASRRARPPRRPRAEGSAISEIPRQGRETGRARRASAGRRDAGEPARRRHHADRKVLHPQQRTDPGSGQGSRHVEDHHRRRGQQQARADARRPQDQVQAGHAAHGAGMRRQRSLVLHAAGARQSMDQRRRRLRRMDRRAALRRAQVGGRQAIGDVHRSLRRRPQPGDASKDALSRGVPIRRRWTRTIWSCSP